MATTMNATTPSICPHNGTAHDGTVLCHWTNSPGARGTLNIFWLCISTLGLCVWNAVHPDVPRPGSSWWRVFGKRVWWLFVGLFMPEMLVLVALGQFRQAWQLLVDIDKEDNGLTQFPWWMYLFNTWRPKHKNTEYENKWYMRVLLSCLQSPKADAVVGRKHCWTMAHSFYAVMEGFVDDEHDPITIENVRIRLALPINNNSPQRIPLGGIPDVSADDIEDRGKAGVLAKSILIWQLFVFVANCFARWHQSLPLSLLEITTIGHSLCSIIAMILWWYKPHSIGEATVIGAQDPAAPGTHSGGTTTAPAASAQKSPTPGVIRRAVGKVLPELRNVTDLIYLTVITIEIAVLYGLPHLLGLAVHFPTFAELVCWKIAAFTVISSPLVMCIIICILASIVADRRGTQDWVNAVGSALELLVFVLVFLYLIASMFLVGESVRQIFALPEGSFHEPLLTSYLPSFS